MTALDTDQPIHDQIDNARKQADVAVPPDVRRYYAGEQDAVTTPDQRMALGDRANRDPQENVLARCVDAMAGRLLFRRFVCEDDDVQDWLAEFGIKNRYANEVVTNTVSSLVDGNNAMSLTWDLDERRGGRVVIHQEPWWDGKAGMYVEVDSEGIAEWAVKEWETVSKQRRRTVYLPDRILRFVLQGEGWEPFGDDDTAVIPWTKIDGTPLGVPVVHFANAITSRDLYGVSALEPLLSLQDALNGSIFDLVASGALNAIPIYTATGVSDADLEIGPGQVWKTGSKEAAFGMIPGGAVTALLDTYRTTKSAIANQFPVSEHIITGGNWPSGLALTKVEGPMISKVTLLGDIFGGQHVLLAHRATEIYNAFGGGELDESAMIRIEYEPVDQLDEATMTQIDQERVGLYRELASLPKPLMLKTGLVTNDEADAIIAERAASQALMFAGLDTGAFGAGTYGQGSGA
ncbi:MAG: hypothetical protein WBA46_11420 [Thermomicrobiales bacterium]